MRAARSSSELNTTARPSRSNKLGSAAARFRTAPLGARLPNSATRPPVDLIGSSNGAHDLAVDPFGRRIDALADRLASYGDAIEMQKLSKFAQHRRNAARGMKILHIASAGRLQIDKNRRRLAHFVHSLEVDRQAEPARRSRRDG